MTQPRITTIVVNWRLKEETALCLQSLAAQEQLGPVLVIDNGSADGSAEYLASRFPFAEVMGLPANIGFGAACNRGIAQALKDPACGYIFLLNNDAILAPHGLSELIETARTHPRAGILGPKIYYRDRPTVVWYAGARCRRGVLAAADTGQGQIDRGQFKAVREVDYAFGAAMFIRRQVFEQIGLFDENFFLYLEDLDFCLRARQSGFSLLFAPQVHILHRVAASTGRNAAWRKYHWARSTLLFLGKHASPVWLGPVIAYWLLVFGRFLVSDASRGDTDGLRACWAGLLEGLASVLRVKRGIAQHPAIAPFSGDGRPG